MGGTGSRLRMRSPPRQRPGTRAGQGRRQGLSRRVCAGVAVAVKEDVGAAGAEPFSYGLVAPALAAKVVGSLAPVKK